MNNLEDLLNIYQEHNSKISYKIKMKNLDMEKAEKKCYENCDWEKMKIYQEKIPNIKFSDIIESIKTIKNNNKSLTSQELSHCEVIGFEGIYKLLINQKNYYLKIKVEDDLSPNRWYNLPWEYNLDNTSYTIYISIEYSRNHIAHK